MISKEKRKLYLQQNKERTNLRRKEYTDKNPSKRMLWSAKRRAKERNLEFNITELDITLPEICPYLKHPLVSKSNRGERREFVYSLDRIDSTKGYIKGNVEVISHLANTMKNTATKEQQIEFAKEILRRHTKTTF